MIGSVRAKSRFNGFSVPPCLAGRCSAEYLNCPPADGTIALSGGCAMSDRDGGNNFMWFLAGLGFGALMGVLYAPRSGRETRESLMTSAQEGREYMKTRGKEARETMNQWVDRGKEVVS